MLNTKNETRGQVLVLFAVALVALFGFAALAIDVAYWYHTKSQLQGAADAAALAGASLLVCQNDSSGAALTQAAARQQAWKFACKNQAAQQSVYLVTNNPVNCDTPPDATALNANNGVNEDIVVGYWAGSNFIEATGSTNNLINAVKVRDRRTGETPGMPKVTTFFGKIFGLNEVNVSAKAIALGCVNLSPISINEYWLGDTQISTDTGDTSCNNPRNADNTGGARIPYPDGVSGGRAPYGKHHLYPNSFVRQPCGDYPDYADDYLLADNEAGNRCTDPINGNIDPFGNAALNPFQTLSCDPSGPTPPQLLDVYPNPNCGYPNTNCIYPNGPFKSAACASDDVECKKGRAIVTFNKDTPSSPTITPSLTAGRVYAVVGHNAFNNSNDSNMLSLIDFDFRSPCSKDDSVPGGCNTWFSLPGFTPTDKADPNRDKDVAADYIRSGIYPYDLPTYVDEIYQPAYLETDPYSSTQPYASTSFFSGSGLVGNMVKANFYKNGNYADMKYAPGKKIIVVVYDGIVSAGGAGQARTTIVGFARVTIFGFGRELRLDSNGIPSISDKTNPDSMYGYIETPEDFKPKYTDLVAPEEGRSRLVQ